MVWSIWNESEWKVVTFTQRAFASIFQPPIRFIYQLISCGHLSLILAISDLILAGGTCVNSVVKIGTWHLPWNLLEWWLATSIKPFLIKIKKQVMLSLRLLWMKQKKKKRWNHIQLVSVFYQHVLNLQNVTFHE